MKTCIRYLITIRTTKEQKRIVVVGNSELMCVTMVLSRYSGDLWDIEKGKMGDTYYDKSGIYSEENWRNCRNPEPENTQEYQNNAVSDNKSQHKNN